MASKIVRGLKRCILLVMITIISCKDKNTSKSDITIRDRYFNLEKKGWKSKSYNQYVDHINFTATEVPIQYYLLKDKGIDDLNLIDSLYEKNKTERVIEFTYHHDEEKDLLAKDFTGMNYDDTIKYFSFGLDKDFLVVTSKNDTIKCSGVNFERNYKVAPYQKILLYFSGIDPNEKIQLIYQDYLFRKGTLKFKFEDNFKEVAL